MNRLKYWNEGYREYWRARVAEANRVVTDSKLVSGDKATVGDAVVEGLLHELAIRPEHVVLDLGCGYGRMLPLLHRWTHFLYGTDISEAMIREARQGYGEHVLGLHVEEAERSSFPSNFFDRIVCVGVFDATFQEAALGEILRLLKPSGIALITGKNSKYHPDDKLALRAEENARQKNHPNFFTHYPVMREQLVARGARIRGERFYARRGDFSVDRYQANCPECFYEYCLWVEDAFYDGRYLAPFSSPVSETWTRLSRAGHK